MMIFFAKIDNIFKKTNFFCKNPQKMIDEM